VKEIVWGSAVQRIFTASRDASICILKQGDQQPLQRMEGHTLVVSALTTDPSNKYVCSGSRDGNLILWDSETGKQIGCKNIRRNIVTGARWIPGEDCIFQTSEDLQLRIWDAKTWQVAQSVKTEHHFPLSCDVSSDGLYLLIGNNGFSSSGQLDGCECQVWDRRMEKVLCQYRGHEQSVNSCCFLPPTGDQGTLRVASGSKDATVQIWDASAGSHIATANCAENKVVTSIAYASAIDDGPTFFCGNLTGSVQAWQVTTSGNVVCKAETPANIC